MTWSEAGSRNAAREPEADATGGAVETEFSSLVLWALRLPVVRRLGLERRPKELRRFLKFATVGALGMVVDLSILNLLHKVFGLHLLVANSISFAIAVVSNFTWNRVWSFPESRDRAILGQLGQFALVNVIGLGINNVVLWAVFTWITALVPDPLDYNLAKVTAIGVVLFWNYGINRIWTYRGIQ